MTLDMVSLISRPVGVWTRGVALRKGRCRPREQRAGSGRMKPGVSGPAAGPAGRPQARALAGGDGGLRL